MRVKEETIRMTGPGRRHERFDIACRARIRIHNRQYAAALENISISGARIRTFSTLKDAGAATLLLPDFPPIHGSLTWADDQVAGIAFEQLIGHGRLKRWLESRLVWQPGRALPIDHYASGPGSIRVRRSPELHG